MSQSPLAVNADHPGGVSALSIAVGRFDPSLLQPGTTAGYIDQRQAPVPIEKVIESIESFAVSLQTKLQLCLFSKAEKEIQCSLTGDMKRIRDVLLMVLQEYQELAVAFRHLMSVPSQPYAVESAQALLQKAWTSTRDARSSLKDLTQALLDRGELLESEVLKEDKHPWLHAMVNRKVPEGSVASGFIMGLGGAIYNTAAADNIEHHVKGAAAVQSFWAFSALILGTTFGAVVTIYGREANVYQAEPRENTKQATASILTLLQQFAKDIRHLGVYWRDTHLAELQLQGAWGGPLRIPQIVAMFEREIENYSKLTASLDKHILMKGTVPLLSPSERYEQRTQMFLSCQPSAQVFL